MLRKARRHHSMAISSFTLSGDDAYRILKLVYDPNMSRLLDSNSTTSWSASMQADRPHLSLSYFLVSIFLLLAPALHAQTCDVSNWFGARAVTVDVSISGAGQSAPGSPLPYSMSRTAHITGDLPGLDGLNWRGDIPNTFNSNMVKATLSYNDQYSAWVSNGAGVLEVGTVTNTGGGAAQVVDGGSIGIVLANCTYYVGFEPYAPATIKTFDAKGNLISSVIGGLWGPHILTPTANWSPLQAIGLNAGLPMTPPVFQLPASGTVTDTVTFPGTFTENLSPDQIGEQVASNWVVTWTITAHDPFNFRTVTLPNPVLNQDYNAVLEASGGLPPYQWLLTNIIPDASLGLSLDRNTGRISAKPTLPRNYPIDIEVRDSRNISIIKHFTLDVKPAPIVVSLVDPVPFLVNDLGIIQDPNLVAAIGQTVNGVAADGVTQVIVRVEGGTVGDQTQLSLNNDQNMASGSSADDGYLTLLDGTKRGNSVKVTSVKTTFSPMAFAIYHAPIDFVRSNNQNDPGVASRQVSILINSGGSGPVLQIVRPPVALVHGLWSDILTWNEFATSLHSANLFKIYPVDYHFTNFESVDLNERECLSQLIKYLEMFKASAGVAATQFDVIGHSMGGLIARDMGSDPRSKMGSNFNQGYVHKLITIDTPHAGSPLATRLKDTTTNCKKYFGDTNRIVGDAIIDLAENSQLLKKLASAPSPPTHAIVGVITPAQDGAASNIINAALNRGVGLACLNLFPEGSFAGLFGGPNDLIVGKASQQFGFIPPSSSVIEGVAHLHLPLLPWLINWLGAPTGALDTASNNPELVKMLLNTPITDAKFVSH